MKETLVKCSVDGALTMWCVTSQSAPVALKAGVKLAAECCPLVELLGGKHCSSAYTRGSASFKCTGNKLLFKTHS